MNLKEGVVMSRHIRVGICWITVLAFSLVVVNPVMAGSHTWDVFEIFSDSTGTIHFIELREMNNTPGETGVNGHLITSLIRNYTVPGAALTPPTSNKSLLFATPAYAALSGVPAPNYIFP